MCATVFLVKTEALYALKILLFAGVKSLTLLSVVGDVGLSEVEEAEVVLGVKFGAERRFERRSAGAAAEGVGDIVFRRDGIGGGAEGELVLFVLGGECGQRRKLRSCSNNDCRFKGR